jgi:hypothetical protein
LRVYPGPPNYESTESGDKPESAYLLELLQPICMRAPKDRAKGAIDEDLDDVAVVHLVPSGDSLEMLQARTGQIIKVMGHLIRAHTAHHRAPLLLVDLRFKPE